MVKQTGNWLETAGAIQFAVSTLPHDTQRIVFDNREWVECDCGWTSLALHRDEASRRAYEVTLARSAREHEAGN